MSAVVYTIEIDEGDGWETSRRQDSYKSALSSGARLSRDFTAVRVRRSGQLVAQWDRGMRLTTFEIQAIKLGRRNERSTIQYKPPYVPPDRPVHFLKDPITGREGFFEVVFDGR
jgi:hypothetical protein